jgi:hypothetical protein
MEENKMPEAKELIKQCCDLLAELNASEVQVEGDEQMYRTRLDIDEWGSDVTKVLHFQVVTRVDPEDEIQSYDYCADYWIISGHKQAPVCLSSEEISILNDLQNAFDAIQYYDLEHFNAHYPGAWKDPDEEQAE